MRFVSITVFALSLPLGGGCQHGPPRSDPVSPRSSVAPRSRSCDERVAEAHGFFTTLARTVFLPSPVPDDVNLARRPHSDWLRKRRRVIVVQGGTIAAISPPRVRLESRRLPLGGGTAAPIAALVDALRADSSSGGAVLVAIDRSTRWQLVTSVLQSLAAYRDPIDVGFLFAVDAPLERPALVSQIVGEISPDKFSMITDWLRAGEQLRRDSLDSKCPPMVSLDPAQRSRSTRQLIETTPKVLRECRCAVDPEWAKALLYTLHYVTPTGVWWRKISRQAGTRVSSRGATRWSKAWDAFSAAATIWPVSR